MVFESEETFFFKEGVIDKRKKINVQTSLVQVKF